MSETMQTGGDDAAANGAADPAIESRARAMGWRPHEEWKDRPGKAWLSAEEFVANGERLIPLMNERNKALTDNVAKLTKQIEEQKGTVAQMVAMARRAERVGYQKAVRELEAKRDSAIRDGDVDTVRAVDREIKELGPEPEDVKPAPAASAEARPDPVVTAWVQRNPWFRSDKAANAYAVGMLDVVKEEEPDLSLEEQLVEVERRVKADLPRLAPRRSRDDEETEEETPRPRRSAPMVSSSTHGDRRPTVKPRSFEAMPAVARQEYERQKKMMAGKGEPLSKEEFSNYYWEQFKEEDVA